MAECGLSASVGEGATNAVFAHTSQKFVLATGAADNDGASRKFRKNSISVASKLSAAGLSVSVGSQAVRKTDAEPTGGDKPDKAPGDTEQNSACFGFSGGTSRTAACLGQWASTRALERRRQHQRRALKR